MYALTKLLGSVTLVLILAACGGGGNGTGITPAADEATVFSVANECFAVSPDAGVTFLEATPSANAYEASAASAGDGSWFLLRPSDLGKYLLYDQDKGYLVSDGQGLTRQMSLAFDTTEVNGQVVIEDRMQSEGEWELLATADDGFILHHIKTASYIAANGMVAEEADAAALTFVPQAGCAEFPELSVDASGDITVTEFDDDSVFGFVDAHSHLFSNIAFGGTGLFHGAPFHPLGVEHALEDCDLVHGEEGRKDLMGAGFGDQDGDITTLLLALVEGELPEKNHDTEGYPIFTDWPNAPFSATHQMQYYKWIERAYMSGLRLIVQHATTNQFLCQLVVGIGSQPERFDCNDMVAVDRIIEATYALERYVDALSGGPGEGWFRIVFSPEEAREQIKAGKLAVVLGIEASDLFDCFLVPFGEFSKCTEADVVAQLDEYYDKGVRVLFPVHKYDNAFSAGDGDRGIIDIGNFGHTGHYNSYVECPEELRGLRAGFDNGGVPFAGLNKPRDVYDSSPLEDMSGVEEDAAGSLLPFAGALIAGGSLDGSYCQKHGLTPLGEFLIAQMMKRGMIIELDHLPRKSVRRTLDLLQENDYPAMGTHSQNYDGLLYELGGMSKSNLGRCRDPGKTATMDDSFQARIKLISDKGGFPAEGFAFDLNGFAGAPGPRFGDRSGCSGQDDEGITYPFTSYAGDVTLEQPVVGDRILDFNTEGMVHLGLVAEVIEDVLRDGVTKEELEPLFKSAEGYIRVWEKSESRGRVLSQ